MAVSKAVNRANQCSVQVAWRRTSVITVNKKRMKRKQQQPRPWGAHRRARHPEPESRTSSLRFTPTAWSKLLFFRDRGDTEIGGFGLSAPNNLSLIEDIRLVEQDCTPVTVAFRDEAVADFFDEQVDAGRQPESFGRCWIHTHPGNCPLPSQTDEETFQRVFGRSDWAVMFIIARNGHTYTRLRFNTGPGGEIELSTTIDYDADFPASDRGSWGQEFSKSVHDESIDTTQRFDSDPFGYRDPGDEDRYDDWLEYTQDDSDAPHLKVVDHA
jgi:hypothetical protein